MWHHLSLRRCASSRSSVVFPAHAQPYTVGRLVAANRQPGEDTVIHRLTQTGCSACKGRQPVDKLQGALPGILPSNFTYTSEHVHTVLNHVAPHPCCCWAV